jgi:anti-sigma B factor antagonist
MEGAAYRRGAGPPAVSCRRRRGIRHSGVVSAPEEIGNRLRGSIAHLDGSLVYALDGEIDSANATRLLERLLRVASAAQSDLDLDMSAVTFFDSSGVRTLLVLKDELEVRDRGVRISRASPVVVRTFDVLGLTGHFGIASPADGAS